MCALCVLVLGFAVGAGETPGAQLSPVRVVKRFTSNYGGPQMDESARWTTARFRSNRPRSVWVVDTWKQLRRLAYKRLHQTVSTTKRHKTGAAVVLQSQIETLAGQTRQKEIYYLIKKDGTWLIDDIQIVDEDVEINQEELSL